MLPEIGKHAEILHNGRIQPLHVVGIQVGVQAPHLLLLHQRVHRHIEAASVQMHVVDGAQHGLLIQIVGVRPGPETGSPDIDRIRAGIDGGRHTLIGSRRRQDLHSLSAQINLLRS